MQKASPILFPRQRQNALLQGGVTHTCVFDSRGNCLTEQLNGGTAVNYVYDAANRLTSVGAQSYTWDNNGNLKNDGARTYAYDSANRPAQIVQGGVTYTFSYNGQGDRVRQAINGTPTRYVLDLNAPLTQLLADGSNTYLYGSTRIGEQQAGGFTYHLPDALGSVRQLTTANASVMLTKSYQPFGEVQTSTGSGTSIFGYAGEARDATGLIFLRARYYHPAIGRFFVRDSWPGSYQMPGTLHPYLYGLNNPILYTDPTGQFSWPFSAQTTSMLTNIAVGAAVGIGLGALCVGTAGIGCAFAVGAAAGAAGAFAGTLAGNYVSGQPIDWLNVAKQTAIGTVAGAVGGAVGGAVLGNIASTTGANLASLTFGQSVAVGAATGAWSGIAAGATGQFLNNFVTAGNTGNWGGLMNGVPQAGAVGGVFGGLGGAVGGTMNYGAGWLSRQNKLYAGLEPEQSLYYGKVRALAGLQRLLSCGLTKFGRMAPAENAALERLAYETGETIGITGGYGESRGGIQARALASGDLSAVPEMNMPWWRNTGVPRGADVDLWAPMSPEAEMGVRRIFGYTERFDYYIDQPDYHPWPGIDYLPAAMKTYIPGQPMQQSVPPWDVSRWMPSR